MRKTLYKRSGIRSVEKIGEEIYTFVSTDSERDMIKNASGKWIPYREGRVGNIVVYEHVDDKNFITGWYKTVRRAKNPDGTYTKWVRYYKRVGTK